MKRCLALVVILMAVLVATCGARAQTVENDYIRIYNLILEGDGYDSTGQTKEALQKYSEARDALQIFEKTHKDWNTSVVKFRLDYLSGKLTALSAKLQTSQAATNSAVAVLAAPETNSAPADWAEQLESLHAMVNELQTGVNRLQGDKRLLEAKLREAFSAQPPAADPAELARAKERALLLEKERDLFSVALENAKAKTRAGMPVSAVSATDNAAALAEANRQLAEQQRTVSRLTLEKEALLARVRTLTLGTNAPALP
jgi:uncharacterized coiled-coil protein SlyX